MASVSYKYLVSLVSTCLLGIQNEAPLIMAVGQFIVHLSAIAISLMPLPEAEDPPSCPLLLSPVEVNFKDNFEEWFPGFPGMIVVRKGWNVIKG